MGVRFLRLSEKLTAGAFESDPNVSEEIAGTFSTVNQLWGGQVGVEGLLFGKRDQGFSVDGVVKLGIFHNRIHNKTHEVHYVNTAFDDAFSDSESKSKNMFLSELGVNANYAFTKNIAMTLGYQLLYLSHVWLVTQEFDTQSVVFQGVRLGVNVVF